MSASAKHLSIVPQTTRINPCVKCRRRSRPCDDCALVDEILTPFRTEDLVRATMLQDGVPLVRLVWDLDRGGRVE